MTNHDARSRHLDAARADLAGEAAEQRTEARHEGMPYEVWDAVPSHGAADVTYYDRPVLKEPVWVWSVPVEFYMAAAGGALSALGAMAQIAGGPGQRVLVRRSRWLATAGCLLSTGLLVHDLGRRERFLNMLRVFRPTSPMSVGSWVLASSTGLNGAAALLSDASGAGRVLGDAAGLGAGGLGLPFSTYSAVLASTTAVPLWQATRRSTPGLFAASGMASGAALLEATGLDGEPARVVRRFGAAGKAAELALVKAVERDASRVERVGQVLHEGVAGSMWRAAKMATALSLALDLLPGRPRRGGSRRRRLLAGTLATGGALSLRFALFFAGKASARDPRATFHQQRAGFGGAEVTGRVAVSGPPA